MAVELSAVAKDQIYIPPGFAHGFCVISDEAEVVYKGTDYYAPGWESTIIWNDPNLKIDWPIDNPIVSDKDAAGIVFSEAELL